METKFVYDLILPYFIGDDDLRPALKKIHKGDNGYLYASNGHIMIRVLSEKVMNEYEAVPKYPNAEKVIQDAFDREGNITATIHTNDLIRMLADVSWGRVKDSDICSECDGDGEVICEHCNNGYECPICKGTGEVNIRIKEYSLLKSNDKYMIKIGFQVYDANYLQTIALAAQMLQSEHITYRYRENREGGIFSFAGVDILLMPYLETENKVMKLNK